MKRSSCKDDSDHSAKPDRKTLEKNRRLYMKTLCLNLFSLIPKDHNSSSKGRRSLSNQIDQAASYTKELQERVEALKRKKQLAMAVLQGSSSSSIGSDHITTTADSIMPTTTMGLRVPILELKDLGSALEVILICGRDKNFMLYQVIRVLEEEGAEVVSTNFSTHGDKIVHIIHCQVKSSRIGIEISSVCKRLKDLVS